MSSVTVITIVFIFWLQQVREVVMQQQEAVDIEETTSISVIAVRNTLRQGNTFSNQMHFIRRFNHRSCLAVLLSHLAALDLINFHYMLTQIRLRFSQFLPPVILSILSLIPATSSQHMPIVFILFFIGR